MTATGHRWLTPAVSFVGLALLLLLVTADTVRSLVTIWWETTTYRHGFLILPVSLFLIWLRRRELRATLPRQEPLALPLLAAFGLLWLLGRAADVQLFQHLAVVGLLVSLAVALFGREVCRTIALPLLFLFAMVPVGEFLIPYLQDFTARFSVALLRSIGVPVFHNGIIIETPSGVYEVAEACAGLRFLIANLVVAVLFAFLAFDRAWKRAVFLAAAVVVPVVANGLRVFAIIYIAYLTDNAYAVGVDHLVYGWGFFAAIMLLLLAVGSRFASGPRSGDGGPTASKPAPDSPPRAWRLGFLAPVALVLLAAPVYAAVAIDRAEAAPDFGQPPPMPQTPCPRLDAALDDWQPRFVGADLTLLQSYACDGRRIDVFVAYYAFERPGAELIHHANRFDDGARWTRLDTGWQLIDVPDLPPRVRRERLWSPDGQRLVLAWYWVGGDYTAEPWAAKLLRARDRLLGRAAPAAVVAVSAPIEGGDPEQTLVRLRGFLGDGPELKRYLAALSAAGGG